MKTTNMQLSKIVGLFAYYYCRYEHHRHRHRHHNYHLISSTSLLRGCGQNSKYVSIKTVTTNNCLNVNEILTEKNIVLMDIIMIYQCCLVPKVLQSLCRWKKGKWSISLPLMLQLS